MNDNKRINQGYEIIESRTIGSKEFVIGHNPNAPNPYVCWHCKNGNDFYWGFFCNTLKAAQRKLEERSKDEKNYQQYNKRTPSKSRDAHER